MTVTAAHADAIRAAQAALVARAAATATTAPLAQGGRPSRLRRAAGVLEDGLWLLLVVYALPLAMLAVMMPFVVVILLVRWLVSLSSGGI